MEAYRNLKRANNLFTFECVLKSPSEVEALKTRYKNIEKYKQDKKYTLEAFEKRSNIADPFSNAVEINIDVLLKAGRAIDRAGFTKAGRALMKHGYREGSVFPKPVGNPTQINELGQKVLESILTHPEKKLIIGEFDRFGKVVDIYAPSIGGARYTVHDKFIGFLEP